LEKELENKKPQKPNSNNNFPTGWVIGGGIFLLVGLAATLVIKKHKKKSRRK
jgi:hypothetical protein